MRFQCPFCQGVVAVPNTDMGSDCQCGLCGEMVSVPTSRVATGSVIQDFIILEELGRGGMGVVYLTHQITLDRPSALKILAGAYANNPEFVVDFIKEARAAAKLNHPHIVQAYAVGEDEGIYFFAMEHIDGETMKDYMKREGVVPIEFALEVIQQIAEALDYAWKEQRLVHRDIKPDNIMLTRKGRAKLADLGLARVAGDIDDADSDEVMGTPQYISPEHLTGEEMDVRSDIYSLGATLFHIITGRFAFEGKTATDIARKHLEEPLQSPREVNPTVPESVSRIIIKMMAKNANERYQSAEDLVEDLRLARQGKGPSSSTGTVKRQAKGGKQFSLKKGGAKTGTYQAASSSGGKTLSSSGSKTLKTTGSKTLSASRGKTLSSSSTGIKRSPLTSTSSSPMSDLAQAKLEKERKAKNQLIIMAAIVVTVLLAGAAFMIWNAMSGDDGKPKPNNGGSNTANNNNNNTGGNQNNSNGQNNVPKVSAYIKSADELLAFADSNKGKEQEIITKCEGFFSANPKPDSKDEEVKRDELMAVYVPLDEKRVKKARAEERKKHEERLKAAEEEAKKLKDEAERKRLAEERQKAREERERQVKLELEQQRKKRLAEFKENLKSDKKSYRYWSLHYSTQQNFKEARKILLPGVKKISKITDDLYKVDAQKMTDWATRMDKHLDIAEKTWEHLSNSGAKYAKIQTEPKPGTLAKVVQIKNGIVITKTFDNKNFSIPLLSLRSKDLKKILSSIDEANLPDGAFHFLFSSGNFLMAEDFMPDDWKDEFETSRQVYLVKRLQDIEDLDSDAEIKKEKTKLYRKAGKAAYLKAVKAMQAE